MCNAPHGCASARTLEKAKELTCNVSSVQIIATTGQWLATPPRDRLATATLFKDMRTTHHYGVSKYQNITSAMLTSNILWYCGKKIMERNTSPTAFDSQFL